MYGLPKSAVPEAGEPAVEPPPQPPPFTRQIGVHAGDGSSSAASGAGGAVPTVSVNVEVALTDQGREQLYQGAIRHAAKHSREELMVVARRLLKLDEEIYAREQQRRVLWGRW